MTAIRVPQHEERQGDGRQAAELVGRDAAVPTARSPGLTTAGVEAAFLPASTWPSSRGPGTPLEDATSVTADVARRYLLEPPVAGVYACAGTVVNR